MERKEDSTSKQAEALEHLLPLPTSHFDPETGEARMDADELREAADILSKG